MRKFGETKPPMKNTNLLINIFLYGTFAMYAILLCMHPAEVLSFTFRILIPIIIFYFAIGVVFAGNRLLFRNWYPWRWVLQSIRYPLTRLHYKRNLKYLSLLELEVTLDALVKERDSWYIRKLMILVTECKLKLTV